MKALKSELARALLNDPQNARVLGEAAWRVGYGAAQAVFVKVPGAWARTVQKAALFAGF